MIVFLDMDGVLADFDAAIPEERRRPFGYDGKDEKYWDPPEMFETGFYRELPVMPGALEAATILKLHPRIELYIGSKPTTKNLACPSEKYQWVEKNFPFLLRRMVLACNKSLLRGDVLVDDDRDWAAGFKGHFIYFDREDPVKSWRSVVSEILGLP